MIIEPGGLLHRPVLHPLLYEHRTRWVQHDVQIPGVVVCPVLTSTCLQSPVGSSVSRSAFQSFRHTSLIPCSCASRDPCSVGSSVSRSALYMLTESGGFLCSQFCPPVLSAHTTLIPCSCASRDPCLPTTTTLERVLLTNQAGSPAISGTHTHHLLKTRHWELIRIKKVLRTRTYQRSNK